MKISHLRNIKKYLTVFIFMFVGILPIIVQNPVLVKALSSEQKKLFDSGIYYFDTGDSESGSSCGCGTTTSTQSGSIDQIIQAWAGQHSGSKITVKDITGNTEANVNGTDPIQSASIYKLFVAEYLYKERAAGSISFDTTFHLRDYLSENQLSYDILEDGSTRDGSLDGTSYPWTSRGSNPQVTIGECMAQMISNSENACGDALKAMVQPKQNSFGSGTTLNPQRTTSNDVTDLLSQIAGGKMVDKQSSQEFEGLLDKQAHRKKIPAGIPTSATVGNKTGELWQDEEYDGHTYSNDAAIVRAANKTYVITVLTTLDPASATDNAAIADLSKQVYDFLNNGGASPCTGGGGGSATLDLFMQAIASHESHGVANTDVGNGAYGKYQYRTPTWEGAVKEYYGDTQAANVLARWPNASDAPESVQDAVTYVKLNGLSQRYNGSAFKLAVVWYLPAALDDTSGAALDNAPENNNGLTIRSFANTVVDYMNSGSGNSGQSLSDIQLHYSEEPDFQTRSGQQGAPVAIWAERVESGPAPGSSQGGSTTASSSSNSSTSCPGGIIGSNTEVDGHAFPLPLKTQKDYNTFNALSAVPCNETSCHHDGTPAFDLGIVGYGPDGPEGAPVLAITDGSINNVDYDYTYNGVHTGCNSIEFKSNDGYIYWYGHLASNHSVHDGQQFKIGEQMGNIGPRICTANGSTPHLHIDRGSPKGSPGGSVCCRDPGIIPLINQLFEATPAG